MTPYYDESGITIYHGDCREILPELAKAELMLTDPPYGINATVTSEFGRGPNSHGGSRGRGKRNEKIVGDKRPFNPSFLLGHAASHVIWGWNNYPDKLPRGTCLVWIKRHDAALGSFLSDAETAWMSKGHGVYCYRVYLTMGLR